MKLKDLTKEQRAAIEEDYIGKKLIWAIEHNGPYEYEMQGAEVAYQDSVSDTIKRIDYEIEFLEEPRDWTFPCGNNIFIDMNCRIRDLKKQKELYELMGELE